MVTILWSDENNGNAFRRRPLDGLCRSYEHIDGPGTVHDLCQHFGHVDGRIDNEPAASFVRVAERVAGRGHDPGDLTA